MDNYWLDLEEQARVEEQQELKKLSGLAGINNKWYSGVGGPAFHHNIFTTASDVKSYRDKLLNNQSQGAYRWQSATTCKSQPDGTYVASSKEGELSFVWREVKTIDLLHDAIRQMSITIGLADGAVVESNYKAPWERTNG